MEAAKKKKKNIGKKGENDFILYVIEIFHPNGNCKWKWIHDN